MRNCARQCTDRPTVLVVEDENWVKDLLSRWLVDGGWRCAVVGSAEEALTHMEWEPADTIVSDLRMPGRSGAWLLDRVIERFPDKTFLMLTGSNDTQSAIDALTHGAAGYLLKPIERDEFLQALDQSWDRRNRLFDSRRYIERLESEVRMHSESIKLAHEDAIDRLAIAAAYRDRETGAHIRRTGLCSELLALAAGWSSAEAKLLRIAAPMHDIGKIGIPDAILQKRDRLTPDEYEIMKRHTTIGANILSGSSLPVLQLAEQIALSHHEHWDGSGYPEKRSGEAIPEAARIVSIVDVYDALSHDRVYRPALGENEVLGALRQGAGTDFDPGLLALFFTVYDDIQRISEQHPDGCDRSSARVIVQDRVPLAHSLQ